MIAVLKQGVNKAQREQLIQWIEAQKVRVHVSEGEFQTVIGLIGDTSRIDIDLLASLEIVEKVSRVSEPFKSASRRFHPDDTIVEVGEGENKVKIGGGNFCMIAGPCSVESEEQIITVAKAVKAAGAKMLRGGAFKPRTSPYDFQGLRGEGLELLMKARKETGLPIVTEIMNAAHLDMFADVDIIQVGARNMQNFELLKELGRSKKPILLKRGLAATLKEFLMSAEYILAEGNENVMLCERGIRSFDTYTRNVLDLASVPMLHELSHLPVVVDPSHATGVARLVKPMACAATVAGADALIIEVHNNPPCALCDGAQSLTPAQFAEVAERVEQMRTLIQK
ncbi:MAG: 3-deoxy-7-phosphoheptulonate synthase [Bacteroidaceae bacterium]|nr:3-deoxy-7-phosphoheptulonate synthase [Bacteroidaceae bacterium]